MTIILLGILGVVVSVLIGMLWYSTKTPMGRIHMKAIGIGSVEESNKKMEEMKPVMWKYYVGQMILSFLTSLFIAYIMIEQKGLGSGIIYGEVSLIWLCFTVPLVGQGLLWGNVDPK